MNQSTLSRLGWPIIIALTLIPLIIWIMIEPMSGRLANPYLSLTNLGRIAGIMAVVLFSFNVILTTRLKSLEALFGGLNKMFIAHHLLGGMSLCIVLLHPIALSLRTATISLHDSAMILLPRLSDIPTAFGIIALWLFIVLMVMTFYIHLPYRIWLFTHKFLGLVLLLIALHVILLSSDTSRSPALKIYLLALIALAIISFIYRTLLPRFFVRRHAYQISAVAQPSAGVIRMSFKPKGQPLQFSSGQFIFVSFQGEGFSHEWHPFSISSNRKDKELAITVKGLGSYTSSLVKLAPGMISMDVMIEGAYGKFNFHNFKAKKQVWVAGGIGITPFLSMLGDITTDYKIDFYYSVKNEAEMIDRQLIEQMSFGSKGALRFIPVITDTMGFLTAKTITKISGDLYGTEILLCGPPPMMHALQNQLKELKVGKVQIHSEEFAMS